MQEKISIDKGVGMEFELDGKTYITLPRRPEVGIRVTTFSGACFSASHLYASFHTYDLGCIEKGQKPDRNKIYYMSGQPKESRGERIEVIGIAKENLYGEKFGRKQLEAKKGSHTMRFDSIHDLIEAVEKSFAEIFGEPWELYQDCCDTPWEEYKEELIKMYGGCNNEK